MAHALNLVGERWALLIVRDLLLGPKRFVDLQAGLPGAGSSILSLRLRDLEAAAVVRRRTLAPPAGSRVYELTEWGAGLEPILAGLGRWGALSPAVPPVGEIGVDSHMLTVRAFFDVKGINPWSARYQIVVDGNAFVAEVVDGRLANLARGDANGRATVSIETTVATLGALIARRTSIAAARRAGLATVEGDVRAAQRLFNAVQVPAS